MASLDASNSMWLALYFVLNLSLTIYNKAVMQFAEFKFPWALTGLHALCGSLGCLALARLGFFQLSKLGMHEHLIMVAFSVLYTINIAVSNVSLFMVTVPFHQVVRATSPLFVILINYLWLRRGCSRRMLLSMIPVVFGVALATFGDYYASMLGFILTIFGSFLGALKTVVTNRIQVGSLKLHPLDLLSRMSPLAFAQVLVYMYFSGEYAELGTYLRTRLDWWTGSAILVNGVLAFALNVVSFTANKKVGPLTISVAANVKQVLSVLLAVGIFSLQITGINGLGITITLLGGAYYSYVDFNERAARRGIPVPDSPSGALGGIKVATPVAARSPRASAHNVAKPSHSMQD